MQAKRLIAHKLQKADANLFFLFCKKSKLEENLIGCETSGFSDPAVPWLWLRKAEIKAAFRAPSLSLSQGEEVLSGEDPSFNSVGERNPWSRSFKQCVFTDPEGEVGEVTRGLALEGSGPFRYSCKLTKKDVRIQAGYRSKYSSYLLLQMYLCSQW